MKHSKVYTTTSPKEISSQNYMSWTTKSQKISKTISLTNKQKISLSNHINTELMLRKGLSKPTKITLYLGSAQSTPFFLYNCGTNYYPNPKILSISFEHPAQTTNYQHTPSSMVNSILTKRFWHCPVQKRWSMLTLNNAQHGAPMP